MLPTIVQRVFSMLSARTGWNYTVLMGGPDPRKENGAMTSMSYHIGETPHGQNFGKWHASYNESVAGPFMSYCHTVFRESKIVPLN
jgi:hypothetical protein